MSPFRVALLQIDGTRDLIENRNKGIAACKRAKDMGADLALFPELYSCGYDFPLEANALCATSVGKDSEFVTAFSLLAKELGMAIGITYLETYDPAPRNTLTVFDRQGKEVLTYAKVHTCDFGDERVLTPGKDFDTAELDTEHGPVRIGAMICYDREFPESARILMLKGAEIILVPNACPMEINRISQLRGRAYENMTGIATVNYPAPHPDCNGHSTAFDGVAYWEGVPGSRDTLLIEGGESEEILLAEFDLDMLRQYRGMEVHGNAYRRPDVYQPLLSREVREPFIRKDKRNQYLLAPQGASDRTKCEKEEKKQ